MQLLLSKNHNIQILKILGNMRGNQNNKQLYWLVFYDEQLYQALRTMAYMLHVCKDKKLSFRGRVKKLLEIFKEYHKSFDSYSDWFHTQYFFRLDTAFDYLTDVDDNYEEFYRGTMRIKCWKN